MAVTHSTAARNAATNAVVDLLDVGTGTPSLVFRTSGTIGELGDAVATLAMDGTNAFGDSSNGTATAASIASDTNAAGSAEAVATATLEDRDDTVVIHCAVAESGSDINMTNGLTVANGDTVSCSSLTYTALTA